MYIYIVYVPWLMFWHNHYVAIIKLTFWVGLSAVLCADPRFPVPPPATLRLIISASARHAGRARGLSEQKVDSHLFYC